VGDYYKGGWPVRQCPPIEDFEAEVSVSTVAGNYAADLLPNMLSKKKGFHWTVFDAETQTVVEGLVPVTLSVSTKANKYCDAQVVCVAVDYQQESHADYEG
jgi:hypothetical protein